MLKELKRPVPRVEATPAPTRAAPPDFAPSPELGEQLRRLGEAQAAIDRRHAEELALLREIQNRD